MFALERINAKIAHLNIRTEKHGEDDVKAVDLKLEAKLPNGFLSELSPTLKWSLYDKPVDPDLVQDESYLPTLRYPKMGPIKWDDQIVGGTLFIHAPVSKKDLAFSADVNNLVLDPQEGGSVNVSFRAQIYPKDDEIGKVAAVLGLTAEITLKPPASTEDEDEK